MINDFLSQMGEVAICMMDWLNSQTDKMEINSYHNNKRKKPIIIAKPITVIEQLRLNTDLESKIHEMVNNLSDLIDNCLPLDKCERLNELVREHAYLAPKRSDVRKLVDKHTKTLSKNKRDCFVKEVVVACFAATEIFFLKSLNKDVGDRLTAVLFLNAGERYAQLFMAFHENNAIKGNDNNIDTHDGGKAKKEAHKEKIRRRREIVRAYVQDHPSLSMNQAKKNLKDILNVCTKTIDRTCNLELQPLNKDRKK